MIVVSDTSVVTSLIHIGHLTLLQKLHGNPFL
jgi:predicted nucleic acid-binding protein